MLCGFTSCEHYSKYENRDNFIQFIDSSYDLECLEAHFNEGTDE